MSTLLLIPIVAIAVYMLYRHVKGAFAGKNECCGCASRERCLKNTFTNR